MGQSPRIFRRWVSEKEMNDRNNETSAVSRVRHSLKSRSKRILLGVATALLSLSSAPLPAAETNEVKTTSAQTNEVKKAAVQTSEARKASTADRLADMSLEELANVE